MAQQVQDLASRLMKVGRGGGIGAGLLIGAGAIAYGIKESIYTGSNK